MNPLLALLRRPQKQLKKMPYKQPMPGPGYAGAIAHLQQLMHPRGLMAHSASYLNQASPGGFNHMTNPQQQTYHNPQMGLGRQVQGIGSRPVQLQATRMMPIQARQSYLNLQ